MAVITKEAPKTLIIKTPGTNCDYETRYAFEKAGAPAEIVAISQLITGERKIGDYNIVTFPGGFSSGDHLGSGEVAAATLVLDRRIADDLYEHALHKRRPVVGICNGFQVWTRTGLLPFTNLTTLDQIKTSLAPNKSGHFEHRWIHLKPEPQSASVFQLPAEVLTLPVAHGEGRFYASDETIAQIEAQKLVVFRYCDVQGIPTQIYPDNPNGALHAIAGICNKEGNVIALMPHPERLIDRFQHPNWRSLPADFKPDGLKIIEGIVNYARDL